MRAASGRLCGRSQLCAPKCHRGQFYFLNRFIVHGKTKSPRRIPPIPRPPQRSAASGCVLSLNERAGLNTVWVRPTSPPCRVLRLRLGCRYRRPERALGVVKIFRWPGTHNSLACRWGRMDLNGRLPRNIIRLSGKPLLFRSRRDYLSECIIVRWFPIHLS